MSITNSWEDFEDPNAIIDDLDQKVLELENKIESLTKENRSYRKLLGLENNENL